MLNAFRAPTLTLLHERLTHRLVHGEEDELDMVTSVDVQLHNTMSFAESMEWEFDFKDLWLTPSRWTKMIREYVSDLNERGKPSGTAYSFEEWLTKVARIGADNRGIAVFRTNQVAARGGKDLGKGGKTIRRWGSCMLAMSYKALPRPQITLYSRTSYLGYLSALDLSVAWVAARYASQVTGVPLDQTAFVWVNEALQFHHFKSLAYLLNHRHPKKRDWYRTLILDPELSKTYQRSIEKFPALEKSRVWMQKLIKEDDEGKSYGDMTYNTYRRIRRRFHTEVMGYEYALQFEGEHTYKNGSTKFMHAYKPLPHTYVENLDFSKIGIPATWSK